MLMFPKYSPWLLHNWINIDDNIDETDKHICKSKNQEENNEI